MPDGPRIRRVVIRPFDLPLKRPFKIATMTADRTANVLVEVEDTDGRIGWGEGSVLSSINGETQATMMAALPTLARLALGRPTAAVDRLSQEMAAMMPGQWTAQAALESAVWDLAAQAAGVPLAVHLGGERRAMPTDMTIGAVEPKEAEAMAEEIVAAGFDIIKLKVGTGVARDALRF
ncbi:MAG: hypothetical protein MH204_02125, partial [Fimbriimonadaceae bacterium]|nr:hypothetical protein [Fimbriimonadaceae bacterium]